MRLRALLVLICASAIYAFAANASERVSPVIVLGPDIFLITIDTLRADHVGCYGDKQAQTPALDSLARDGLRNRQWYANGDFQRKGSECSHLRDQAFEQQHSDPHRRNLNQRVHQWH